MQAESRQIEVAGRPVRVLTAGPEEGRPVVLLHGASFQATTWREIGSLDVLAEASHRAVAIDLPGHGKSDAIEGASWPNWAQVALERLRLSRPLATALGKRGVWLRAVLDTLGLDRPVVVAPSMSGAYALPLVTGDPDRVSGFVAVAPVGIETFRERLKHIRVPVLAIWGEHDRTIPVRLAETLIAEVQDARLVVMPGGSHAPYMSDPAAFHREVLCFLSESSP